MDLFEMDPRVSQVPRDSIAPQVPLPGDVETHTRPAVSAPQKTRFAAVPAGCSSLSQAQRCLCDIERS